MRNQRGDEKLFIRAFREIRATIIRRQLKPGDLLPSEAQLCQDLGVSRNVLREAIKSMELMGMVAACPGRGTQVCNFSLDFIFQNVLFFHMLEDDIPVRQMFDIRKTLELGYMRQAFDTITREDVDSMGRLVEQMMLSWEQTGNFDREDKLFHQTLFRSVNNPVLFSLLDAIWSVDTGYQLQAKRPHLAGSVVKHRAIVEALEAYDYMAFARAMQAHFSSGKYTTRHLSYEEY